jgi:ABC-type transport system substrate-binding protein
LIGALIILGLALVLRYANPGEKPDSLAPTPQTEGPSEPPQTATTQPQQKTPNETGSESSETELSKVPEVPPSTEFSSQIEIVQTELFPANRLISLGGRLAIVVTVKNTTSTRLSEQSIVLRVDGKVHQRQAVDLEPGERRSIYMSVEALQPAGRHEIQVNNTKEKFSVTVLDPAHALQREDAILPQDPKFVGAAQGISAIGLPGGTLYLSIKNGPRTFNPVVALDEETIEITRQLHGTLIELNPITGEVEPGLAASWEFSADRRALKLYLRRGVKFSDGQDFSADDVLFTFKEVLFHPEIPARESASFSIGGTRINVKKIDPYIIQIESAVPFQPLLHALAGPAILPRHKLSPGAGTYWKSAQSLIEQDREVLRPIAADTLNYLTKTLNELEFPTDERSLTGSRKTALQSQIENKSKYALQLIEALRSSAPEAAVRDRLDRARDLLAQAGHAAKNGQLLGIAPARFHEAWSVQEIREHPEKMAGLGPFIFHSYDPQRRLILERNSAYWKTDEKGLQLPYLDRLVLDVVTSADRALLNFQKGQLDLYETRPQDWSGLVTEAPGKGWALWGDQSVGGQTLKAAHIDMIALNFDASDPALRLHFRELRFRRALAHAADHPRIIGEIYQGLAAAPALAEKFDPARAKALLDELGLRDANGDGVRERSDGGPLGFTLLVNRENEARVQVAQLYAETLNWLGLRVTVQPLEFNALIGALLAGQFEAALVGLSQNRAFYFNSNIWKSDGALHFWHPSAKTSPLSWEAQLDQLFARAGETFEARELDQIDQAVQRVLTENLPVIWMATPYYLLAARKSLANIENINAHGRIWAFTHTIWWRDDNRRFQ